MKGSDGWVLAAVAGVGLYLLTRKPHTQTVGNTGLTPSSYGTAVLTNPDGSNRSYQDAHTADLVLQQTNASDALIAQANASGALGVGGIAWANPEPMVSQSAMDAAAARFNAISRDDFIAQYFAQHWTAADDWAYNNPIAWGTLANRQATEKWHQVYTAAADAYLAYVNDPAIQ